MKKKIETNQYEKKFSNLLDITNKKRVSHKEEKELNSIDANITTMILKTEKRITCQQHTHPWSPELHEAVTSVFIWKKS